MFEIHPTLKKDLIFIKDINLCSVYQLPSSDNPWVVLVPKVNNVTEWFQLNNEHQIQLTKEVNFIAEFMHKEFKADKINIGALGNMVSQLHLHIIVRFKSDKCWPGSIWGSEFNSDKDQLNYIKNKVSEHINQWSK